MEIDADTILGETVVGELAILDHVAMGATVFVDGLTKQQANAMIGDEPRVVDAVVCVSMADGYAVVTVI